MRLRRGDVIIVKVDQHVSAQMAEHIRAHVKSAFPSRQCLVLGGGMHIGAVGEGRAP